MFGVGVLNKYMKKPLMYAAAKVSLDKSTSYQLILNALLVSAAAGLTYVVQNQSKLDLGTYTPVAVAVATIALQWVQKVLSNPVNPAPAPLPAPDDKKTDKEVDFPIK